MSSAVTSKWIYDNAGFVIDDFTSGRGKVPLEDFEHAFKCTVADTEAGRCVILDSDRMPSKKSVIDFVKSYPN